MASHPFLGIRWLYQARGAPQTQKASTHTEAPNYGSKVDGRAGDGVNFNDITFFFPILRHITQTVDVVSGARDASDISQSMERVRKDQTPRRPLCLVTVVCFGFRHMTCVGIARKAA